MDLGEKWTLTTVAGLAFPLSEMSDSSANRSFESDLYNVSVEQNRFTKRIELFVHDSD